VKKLSKLFTGSVKSTSELTDKEYKIFTSLLSFIIFLILLLIFIVAHLMATDYPQWLGWLDGLLLSSALVTIFLILQVIRGFKKSGN